MTTTATPLPKLEQGIGSTVAPGDRLARSRITKQHKLISGPGTYVKSGQIYASVVGTLGMTSTEDGTNNEVSVTLAGNRQLASEQVLSVGQIVLGKVVRINIMQVTVEIYSQNVGMTANALSNFSSGIIRKEDVRSGASEEVEIISSYRPGDVILAKILSLGDSRRYFLTTAEADLGVVRATCASSGKEMVPISWKEMQCPVTKVKEARKCAKPRQK
uniref:S1 motif domain-containing protein n=1 Tax=Leptocylindrus danicus TaxID=163516 RepID=A0A7S2KFB3_9STRA|mmetsp:Transcript_22214/g.33341  ORF Transcript_22214/g.33341 Transcript_22214/m.33341 type:complete len:217 (+) Transcript_22214:17-667(+)